jgi:hypothetical protein
MAHGPEGREDRIELEHQGFMDGEGTGLLGQRQADPFDLHGPEYIAGVTDARIPIDPEGMAGDLLRRAKDSVEQSRQSGGFLGGQGEDAEEPQPFPISDEDGRLSVGPDGSRVYTREYRLNPVPASDIELSHGATKEEWERHLDLQDVEGPEH